MAVNAEKAELIEHILELQERVYRALRPIMSKEWLRTELTMPQFKVLLLLFTDGPARMGVLASNLGISLATATGIVDRLVERELIVREGDPEDRRVVLCKLSDKGQELVGHLWESVQTGVRSLLEKMTTPELRLARKAMRAILQAALAMERDPASRQVSQIE